MTAWLLATFTALASQPATLFAVIFALTFVLEDAVAVAAGLLAGRMSVDPALALTAVVAGTVAGDLALHAAGRWLSESRAVCRLRAADAGRIEGKLRRHGLVAVALARFVPGTRLPVFLGSGLVGLPFWSSAAVIAATTLVWTPGVFWLSYGAGDHVLDMMTPANLLAAAVLVAFSALAPRFIRSISGWRTSADAVAL